MQLKQVTARGEEHGLINTLGNSVQGDNMKRFAPEYKEQMKKLKEDESQIKRARYVNHRGSHERLTKPYCRWAGDPIQIWHLIPGQEYDLPMGFIREVNESGLIRRSKLDTDNSNIGLVEGKDQIHELIPCSF